jgi:hypothetical protein
MNRDPADADVRDPRDADEPPPIGGSWRNLYIFVLVVLALLVAIFYGFTAAFA